MPLVCSSVPPSTAIVFSPRVVSQSLVHVLPEQKAKDPAKAKALLTEYAIRCGEEATKKAWALGDLLWTKYDEKF